MRDETRATTLTQAVMAFALALLALIGIFRPISPALVTAITGVIATALTLSSLLWQRWLVARGRVVEQTPDGHTVLAGPANELPTGELIRTDLGDHT